MRLEAFFLAALLLVTQQRPGIFRIAPVRSVSELRVAALKATPPKESGESANRIWWTWRSWIQGSSSMRTCDRADL